MRKPPSAVLTSKLLGDPRPDREALSAALIKKHAADFLRTVATDDPDSPPPAPKIPTKVQAVLNALGDRAMTIPELAQAMGVSVSAASDRAAFTHKAGLLVEIPGRPKRYARA